MMEPEPMPLLRQGGHYLAFGILQLLLDWSLFVAFTALGLPAAPANLASRTSAATLGFWLNGRYTFADGEGSRLGWRRFARFWALWLLMTALSTVLVATVESRLGLRWAWLAKPVVEGGLAVANFFLLRRLVYR
jgi:putative flippase GtrA